MSWTDADTIKRHLQAFAIDALTVRFHPVRLEGIDPVQLPHATLASGSVALFAMQEAAPTGPEAITLTDTAWANLGTAAILPESLVLAKEALLEVRYSEGGDYAVDELNGRVKRIDGGAISSGSQLQAWYLPLTRYVENVDYSVELATGRIKRIPTGSLPDPAALLVCYSTSAAGASDELIGQAIDDAEAKIVDRLKDGYDASSTDTGLTIGASELTLALLCDDLALRALSAVGDGSADNRARRFLELSRRYEERAISTLSRFLRLPLPAASTRQANPPAAAGW